jgi:hypothetical protein
MEGKQISWHSRESFDHSAGTWQDRHSVFCSTGGNAGQAGLVFGWQVFQAYKHCQRVTHIRPGYARHMAQSLSVPAALVRAWLGCWVRDACGDGDEDEMIALSSVEICGKQEDIGGGDQRAVRCCC